MNKTSFSDMYDKNAENSNESWSSSGRLSKLKIKRRRQTSSSIKNLPSEQRHNDEITKLERKKRKKEDQTNTSSSLGVIVNGSFNNNDSQSKNNNTKISAGSSQCIILDYEDSGSNHRGLYPNNEIEKYEGTLPSTFDQPKNKAKKVSTFNHTMQSNFWVEHNNVTNKMWGKEFPDPFKILGLDTNKIERLKNDLIQQKKNNDTFFWKLFGTSKGQKDECRKREEDEPSNHLPSQSLDNNRLIHHSFLGEVRFSNPQSRLNNNTVQLNATQNNTKPVVKDECILFSRINAPWKIKDLTFPQQISTQTSKTVSKTNNQRYSRRLYQGDGTLTSLSSLGFPLEMQVQDQNNLLSEERVERIGEPTLEYEGEIKIVAHQGATIRQSFDIDEDDLPPLGHLKNGAVRKYIKSRWLLPPLDDENHGGDDHFLIRVRRFKIILQSNDVKWNKDNAPTTQFGWISDRCRLAHDPYQIAKELKK